MTEKKPLKCLYHAYWRRTQKETHIFSVFFFFLHFCKQYPSRSYQNTLWQVTKRDRTWEKWMFYEASRMQHCLVWMFVQKKKFAFWWVTCSIIVNTGSVKWVYVMSKLYYNISTTYMKCMSLLSHALVIWGIFRSIVLSFSPQSLTQSYFFVLKTIVCVCVCV